MKKIIFVAALMSLFSFPLPNSHGQSLPKQPVPQNVAGIEASAAGELTNLLFLSDFSLCPKQEDIRSCAGRMLDRAEKVTDPELRRIIVFSLSKIQNSPEKLEEIRRDHLEKISDHFAGAAFAARNAKRNEDALAAVQIAVRCNPANANARMLFASLIEPKAALQTLHYGIKFLDINSEVAPKYFDQYFKALSNLQQDRIAAKQGLALLTQTALPDAVRIAVANHTALALYAIGEYAECIKTLDEQNIAGTQQGLILKARALFDSGDTKKAINLLDDNVKNFPAEKRDIILSQLSRFYQSLGRIDDALEVAVQRVKENPTAPAPYLQRLYLYNRLGNTARFDEELKYILTTFSSSQTALFTLANFAAENGKIGIAEACVQLAIEKKFPPQILVATVIESKITAGVPVAAIDSYIEVTRGSPRIFEGMESAMNAILAAAYARAGALEQDLGTKETFRTHAEQLLAMFLSDPKSTPENMISVTNLFRRIGENKFALDVAQQALNKFPWHAQLRADVISLRIALGKISAGEGSNTALTAEIKALENMRRPNPEIWREIALWLASSPRIPAETAKEIRDEIAPLVRNDLSPEALREY